MEVVIALTILSMITGTLFAIIQGSVRGAAQIEQLQRENDSINRFLDLCRKSFTTLPSTATIKLALVQDMEPVQQELTISGSPSCFAFGFNPITYKDTILGLRPDPAGATDQNGALIQYLSLSREDLIPETDDNAMALRQETTGLAAPDEQGRHWMPLLPGVVQLKWRFYKADDDTWLEEWDDSEWPALVEVQLVMKDRTNPIRMVYSVPVIKLTVGTGQTSSSSGSSSSSTTNNSSNQGGQGGGPGGGGERGRGPGGGGDPRRGPGGPGGPDGPGGPGGPRGPGGPPGGPGGPGGGPRGGGS
ncbi:MAG: hypothetical protein U0984_02965 [Prosthecobacter sp.]|nr:hypothetical protein [Prosthecobacter sp.]